jgi:hypothetical protein
MSKTKNYTTNAAKLLERGAKFAKDGAVAEKQLEFANAYAKLVRSPEACQGWVDALLGLDADDRLCVPFIEKRLDLQANLPIQEELPEQLELVLEA